MSAAITAVFVAAGASYSANESSNRAQDRAGRRQRNAMEMQIEEERRQYEQNRADLAPWREAGGGALARLDRASTGDMSDFETSPGYNWRMEEGTRNLGNVYSSKSGGGNAMRDLAAWSQNFASEEFGNWWNRQAGLAGVGQTAATNTAILGSASAGRMSNIWGQNADDMSSLDLWGSRQNTNAMNAGVSNSLYGMRRWWEDRNPPSNNYSTGQDGYSDVWGPPAASNNDYDLPPWMRPNP